MTDNELDEMLDLWMAPAASPALRARVKAHCSPARRFVFRPLAFAGFLSGVAVAALLCLSIVGFAFPQVLFPGFVPSKIPYIAESNVTLYAEDGSSRIDKVLQSYSYKGTEIIVDESVPAGRSVSGARKYFADAIRGLLARMRPVSAEREKWFREWVRSGCGDAASSVIGQENILGYPAAIIRYTVDRGRLTFWRAPDLGCFDLKRRAETLMPNGAYRLTSQTETIKVIMSCRTRSASGICTERYSKYPFD